MAAETALHFHVESRAGLLIAGTINPCALLGSSDLLAGTRTCMGERGAKDLKEQSI